MKSVPLILVMLAVLAVICLSERWRWNECRHVGHGVLYCLSEQSK